MARKGKSRLKDSSEHIEDSAGETDVVETEHSGQYEAHDSEDESDDERFSTSSVPESVFEFVLENGRQYFNDTYFMPCDDIEQTRQTIIHQLCLLLLENGLYHADLSTTPIRRILDVGCGTGEWAISMGHRFPDAEIVAVDIGPYEIDPDEIPSNVNFLIDDAEDEWDYTEPFDYIHLRLMSGAFADWTFIYREAFRNLRPGGILEISDWDYGEIEGVGDHDYLSIFGQAIKSAADISGYPRSVDHLRPQMLQEAGFTNITRDYFNVPIGDVSDDDQRKQTIGKMSTIILLEGVEAQSLRLLTKYKRWSLAEVKDICEKVSGELRQLKSVLSARLHLAIARKPLAGEEENLQPEYKGKGKGKA